MKIKMTNGNTADIKYYKCRHYYVSIINKSGLATPFRRMSFTSIKLMVGKEHLPELLNMRDTLIKEVCNE